MQRSELEHVIRAAGAIAQSKEIVILGSQAILGSCPDAPPELRVSQEVDAYPVDDPARADLIDGSIGELSPFHEQFGYYAHGVGPETARLPAQWHDRVVAVRNQNTGDTTGLCLSPADLAVSKLLAGRPKDVTFVRAMLKHGIVSQGELASLTAELDQADAARLRAALKRLAGSA